MLNKSPIDLIFDVINHFLKKNSKIEISLSLKMLESLIEYHDI